MIKSTNDYTIFKKSPSNRDIEDAHVRNLMSSISIKDMLHLRPIMVNTRMEVLDGQHRLEAAKRLNVKIFYQLVEDSVDTDIILLNAHQKNWTLEAYFNFYVKQGHPEYIKLKMALEKNNMLFKEWMALSAHSNRSKDAKPFKTGSYKFPNEEDVNKIVKLQWQMNTLIKFIRDRRSDIDNVMGSLFMRRGLALFLARPDVVFEELMVKVEQKIDVIGQRSGAASYYQMYLQIYNHRRKEPLGYDPIDENKQAKLF